MTFLPSDRALCRNALMSSLTPGTLYYVSHIEMSALGVQVLYLIGEPTPWQASRFERVPDPTPRRWPSSK